jgi:hypothetical protein
MQVLARLAAARARRAAERHQVAWSPRGRLGDVHGER